MKQSYDFNIKQIKNLSVEEKNSRQKSLDLFYKSGFPSKQVEDWKFTDLNLILKRVMKTLDLRGSDVSILLKQMMGKICVAQAKKIIMDLERFGAFEGNLNELH